MVIGNPFELYCRL